MIGSPCPRFPPGVVWLLSDILLSGNVHSGLSTVRVRAVRVSESCIFCSLNRLPLVFADFMTSDI